MRLASLTDWLEEKGLRVNETIANNHVSAIPRLAPSFEPMHYPCCPLFLCFLYHGMHHGFLTARSEEEDSRWKETIFNHHVSAIPRIAPSFAPDAFLFLLNHRRAQVGPILEPTWFLLRSIPLGSPKGPSGAQLRTILVLSFDPPWTASGPALDLSGNPLGSFSDPTLIVDGSTQDPSRNQRVTFFEPTGNEEESYCTHLGTNMVPTSIPLGAHQGPCRAQLGNLLVPSSNQSKSQTGKSWTSIRTKLVPPLDLTRD